MTIRGTSNQTTLTRVKHVLSVTNEMGPGDGEGGAGLPGSYAGVYREIDNGAEVDDPIFVKGNQWLQWGEPQYQVVV
mgnify:CR=1 FL=1